MKRLIIAAGLVLGGCAGSPYDDVPFPMQLADGSIGYVTRGYVMFQTEEAPVKEEITRRLTLACGGEPRLVSWKWAPIQNVLGTTLHSWQEAIAACPTEQAAGK